MISLHGSGGREGNIWERNCQANVALCKSERRKQYPCFVIAPTVKKVQRWNVETLKTLFELISSLQTKHAIDPERIYVTRQSMGTTVRLRRSCYGLNFFPLPRRSAEEVEQNQPSESPKFRSGCFMAQKIPSFQWRVAGKWLKL